MRTNSKRGRRALVMAVLALTVSLSERAWAQQGGLFPLAPIRRERPACQNEDPVYKFYKHQYFGYHPTCWRTFPAGWGCPSKEVADKAKIFHDQPLGRDPEMSEEGAGPEEEMAAPPAGNAPLDANLPPDRDPFATDPGQPRANPLPRGNQAPQATPPPDGARSPFDEIPKGASLSPSQRGPRTRTAAPAAPDNAPDLMSPAGQPEQDAAARSTAGIADDPATRGDDGPVLAVDDSDAPRAGDAGSLFDAQPVPPAAPTTANPPPAPRRGILGNLFGGLGLNWLRR